MSTPVQASFGQLLRRYRLAAGYSQERLATLSGLGVRTIADLECGVSRYPHPHTVEALTGALHLTGAVRSSFASAARRPGAASPQDREQAPSTDSDAPIFVGRASELAIGARFLAGEGPSVLLFAGEPGIGKSRLLRELASLARGTGWRVVAGGCDQRSGREPYAPFVEALDESLLATPPSRRKGDLKDCDWLARLGPELAEKIRTSVPEWSLTPEQERRMIFAATRRYLTNIAGPTGTLLILDDLQWAGSDALDLLAFLVHTRAIESPAVSADASPRAALRVLGAYRTSEVQSGHPLENLILDLAHDGRVGLSELAHLSEEEARSLATSLVGSAPNAEQWVTDVVARTDGVPFYLVNFAQAFHPDNNSTPLADKSGVPTSEVKTPWLVTATIRRRLSALPPVAQEMLALAAIIGRVAPLELLRLTLKRSGNDLTVSLEAACRARLLEEVISTVAAYRFTHDLIRETVFASLSTARQAHLHRTVADTLEQLPEPERKRHIAALADHLTQAGEPARALPYVLLAGDQAAAVYAHSGAERHFRVATSLAADLGDRAREAEALEKLGRILGSLSRPADERAAQPLVEAARAYEALGDAEGELRVLAALAWVQQGHAIEQAEAALARIEPRLAALESVVAQTGRPSPALALATLYLSILYTTAGRLHSAVALVDRGVEIARAAGDDAVLAWAYMARGYIGLLSRSEGTLADLLEALVLAEGTHSDYLAMGLNFVKRWYLFEGQFARAKQYAARALAVDERRQVPSDIAFMRFNVGELAFYGGDWDEARDHFSQAAALQGRQGPTFTWGISAPAQVYVCLLELAQGRAVEESIRRLESLLALASMRERVNHECLLTSALGEVALAERELLTDHVAAAHARLAAFLDRPGMAEHPRMAGARVIASPTLAWAEGLLGEVSIAEARLQTTLADTWPLYRVDALRIQGVLAILRRRWEVGIAALEEAIERARAMPFPYAELKALWVYGQLEAARGDLAAARVRFEEALSICDRLGEGLYRPHIERDLAAIG